jgi:mono/diheme cytochrome c family protein
MNSATKLAEENRKLRTASQRQRRKQDQRRQYIARGGALQAQQGQQLAAEAERVDAESEQAHATQGPQRAPPTCSKCHVQGHTRTQCVRI